MSAPPTADMLTIMFEQSIKTEPMAFYSTCPPPQAQLVPQSLSERGEHPDQTVSKMRM